MPGIPDGFYPRAILRANGTIVASIVHYLGQRMGASIFESKDGGVSFALVGKVDDPRTNGGLCCGTLYELPKAIGAMPAGTLLWSASVGGDSPNAPMTIPVWKSADDGRTWTFVSNVATAGVPRRNGGLWEPEFSMLDDGSLACHYSDETDGVHSQKLMVAKTTDGVGWGQHRGTVVMAARGNRPGMPVVRRPPGGPFVMTYEICALPNDSCTAFARTSADGWNWGDVVAAGTRITTHDGRHLRHAPTLAWSAAPGARGRLYVVGQMTYGANGAVSPDNGTVIFASSEGIGHGYYTVPAPVPVPNAYDNFCPNYSSTLIPLENGTVGLEIASRWDGNQCKSYFARGPLIDGTDGTEIKDGTSYRLVNVMSNQCLDVAGGGTADGTNVIQYGCNGGPAQRWTVLRAANGTVALRAAVSNKCLNVVGNANAPGAEVDQATCDGGAGQAWKLRNVGAGYFALVHGQANCLDVAGGSTAQGANVAQWTCNDLAPQIWRLEPN